VAGQLYLQERNPTQAIEVLTTAIRLQPNLAPAHFVLGTAYERKGELDRAVGAYKKGLELSPKNPAALNNIAYIYADQGKNLDEALELARRAVELAPNTPSIQDTLGYVHYRRGEYDRAESLLRKAAETLRNNATVHYHLGMTYYRLGRKEEAGVALRRSLQIDERFAKAAEIRQLLKELGV
jgi:Flp pilus assembly protein TadD